MPARVLCRPPARYSIRVLERAGVATLCEGAAAYRPRRPEATLLYRLVAEHLEEYLACHEERFERRDGPLAPHARQTLERFLECGRLQNGFARIRCGDCGAERLLAFSCQTRNLCSSCQGKRAALLGEKLATEILAPVPHSHVIFTVPIALRGLFQRDRRLLGIISRAAYRALAVVMQAQAGAADAVPGFVASLQTFGSYAANWHPHVHGIVTEGVFERDGTFRTVWELDMEAVAERFRQEVIRQMRKAGRLSDDFAETLLEWEHSGFSAVAGRQCAPGETRRIEEMGSYIARPPLAQDLPQESPDGRVLVPTPPDPRTGATELVLDPLEFLHRVVLQIPDRGQHLVRYYGAYSCRGRRADATRNPWPQAPGQAPGNGAPGCELEPETTAEQVLPARAAAASPGETRAAPPRTAPTSASSAHEELDSEFVLRRRRSWARLIRRIFEVDPLACPRCQGTMKVIAVITDPQVVDRILRHIEGKKPQQDPPGPDPPLSNPPAAAPQLAV